MNKLKFVKLLVVFLSSLIVFGMILVGQIIYKKAQKSSSKEIAQINLQQPKGSYIADIKNSDEMLYLLIRGGKQPDRVITVNSTNLSVVADIELN